MTLKTRIFELSQTVFGFDFVTYLKENKKSLFAVKINPDLKTYEEICGEIPVAFMNKINSNFVESEAGYSYNIHKVLPGIDIVSDLFLIHGERLEDNQEKLDAIIIHELCHLMIESCNVINTSLVMDDAAKYLGKKLWDKTDTENEHITRHTHEFCIVLAAASSNAHKRIPAFKSKLKVLDLAMRFDMKGRLRLS